VNSLMAMDCNGPSVWSVGTVCSSSRYPVRAPTAGRSLLLLQRSLKDARHDSGREERAAETKESSNLEISTSTGTSPILFPVELTAQPTHESLSR
jgi:hypothetical protein